MNSQNEGQRAFFFADTGMNFHILDGFCVCVFHGRLAVREFVDER